MSRASVILLFFLAPLQAQADNVVFNEIAWMGTASSSSDEWIELYNNAEAPTNLEGWKINIGDAKQITLKGEIPSKGYYLLERTDDNAVPGVAADLIYSGALKNSGEKLELYDSSNNLIDFLDCSSGWFAGDNETKQTMEKIDPLLQGNASGSWQTGESSTPKSKNSLRQKTEADTLSNEFQKDYPDNIVFSEILPSPEGPDAENEWIELFNKNDFDVDLSGWKITDSVGATKTFVLPGKTTIGALGFLVVSRPETKITLNNEGDSLKMAKPDDVSADEITYGKAPSNQSYNVTENGWSWSKTLTPNAKNIIFLGSNEKKEDGFPTTSENALEHIATSTALAEINKPFQESEKSNKTTVPLIAFFTAALSCLIVFGIKRSIS